MRKLVSLVVMMVLCCSLSFATDNGTKLDTIQSTTEKTTENSGEFYDFEVDKGESKEPVDAINSLSNKVDQIWDVLEKVASKHSLKITLLISLFSCFMFFMFKLVRNKAAQKGAFYMTLIPVIIYIVYMYLGPFLNSIR